MKDFLKVIVVGVIVVFCALLILGFLLHELNFSFEGAVITIILGSFAVAILWTVISPIYSESRTLTDFFKNLSSSAIGLVVTIIVVGGGLWLVFKVAITALAIVCLPLLLIPDEVWRVMGIIFTLLCVCLLLFDKRCNDPSNNDPSNTSYYTSRIFINDSQISSMHKELEQTEEKYKSIKRELDDLKSERDRIPTYNGLLGGSGLSEYEIQCNRRRCRELDGEIWRKGQELCSAERELKYKREEVDLKQRELEEEQRELKEQKRELEKQLKWEKQLKLEKQRELEEQQRESKNNRHKP